MKKTQTMYLEELDNVDKNTHAYDNAIQSARAADEVGAEVEHYQQQLFKSYKYKISIELATGKTECEAVVASLLCLMSQTETVRKAQENRQALLDIARAARAELQESSEA